MRWHIANKLGELAYGNLVQYSRRIDEEVGFHCSFGSYLVYKFVSRECLLRSSTTSSNYLKAILVNLQ